MHIDKSIKCFNENEDCNDAILERIPVGLHAVDKNDDEDEPEVQRLTTQDAKRFIAGLQKQEGNENRPIKEQEMCSNFIKLQSLKRKGQFEHDEFLKNTNHGEDYDRLKLLDIEASEAERLERKKKKKNPDTGFADYEQATIRQYNRLVKNMKPNMGEYEQQREKLGDAFYGGQNTILHGLHKDSKEGIDRMVEDLEKQISKREKYSRRRMHNDDADIDYINERNMKFNEKLERFYGQHTTEIKQNLERGTAV